MFIMSFAFSAFPVIMPLLAISFFGLNATDMSFLFVYFGLLQIFFQGYIMAKLTDRINEEKLIAIGAFLMMIAVFFMAIFPNLVIFFMLTTIMMAGSGMLQTSIPSYISKKTAEHERGGVLGIIQSVSSIARVPGPLIGGLVYEFAGIAAPFFLSAFLLMLATVLGIKIVKSSNISKPILSL
jgi:MFS family permease